MANPQLQSVLDHIDKDFDNSLERLFSLLRIKSISADPAFAGDCKAAAEHLAKDIASLGVATEGGPAAGRPAGGGGGGGGGRPRGRGGGRGGGRPGGPRGRGRRPPGEPAGGD